MTLGFLVFYNFIASDTAAGLEWYRGRYSSSVFCMSEDAV